MNEPRKTKLDTRFSDPDAVAMAWGVRRRVLETAELFWIFVMAPPPLIWWRLRPSGRRIFPSLLPAERR